MKKQKRAIIVDDSFLIRKIVRNVLENLNYRVVGEASNGVEAIRKVNSFSADLLIIDVMMPKMDGLTALTQIMRENPIKTLVVSAYDAKQMSIAYRALENGAIAFIQKNTNLSVFENELKSQIKLAEEANLPLLKPKLPNKPKLSGINRKENVNKRNHLVIIGASTGGPNIIHEVISKLRKPFPPVIVIQHLPSGFTESFTSRLQSKTELNVIIAEDEMSLNSNNVYIAPGGKHLILKRNSKIFFQTYIGDRVNGVMPSLDPTIISASEIYEDQLTIAIFTGMGNDGLAGVRSAKKNNAFVLTQNKESCVIYGMPKAINDQNLSDYINAPENIIMALNHRLSG